MLRTFLIPILASAVMGVVSRLLYDALVKVLGGTAMAMLVSLAVAVIVAVVLYFVCLLLMKGLTERELRAFPKGHVLVKIAKKLRLI